MSRKFVVLAAVVAAFAFTAQAATAGERKPVNPVIDATNFWVGGAWTAVLFGINHWDTKWDAASAGISSGGAIVGTTIGCMATSPMVATVALNRPLSYREAHILMGSCLIPVIGGWVVNEAYNNGWLWAPDERPVRVASHKKSKMAAKPTAKTANKLAAAPIEMAAIH
jgi:hypothetical protein